MRPAELSATALHLRKRLRDPNQSCIDRRDLRLQTLKRQVPIKSTNNGSAARALQHGNGTLFTEGSNKATLKGTPFALRTS